MRQYLDLVQDILDNGTLKSNRTGIDTLSITGAMLKFDLRDGFPLITTRKAPIKSALTELEFFIKGYTDKRWLEERGCKFWSDWCNPQIVPYGTDEETKRKMREEHDLGPVYGKVWNNFNNDSTNINQLQNAITTLKTDPTNRRILVSAYNPTLLLQQALPPCHYVFQLLSDGKHLDLSFNMRSNDVALGLGANIAEYAALLMLIAEQVGMTARYLVYFGMDVHIYTNHIEGLKEQLKREPKPLPKLTIIKNKPDWTIYDWDSQKDWKLEGYNPYPPIKMEVAV
jgi:thymidylate synthase